MSHAKCHYILGSSWHVQFLKKMKTLESCDDTLEIQHNALMGSAIHIMAEIC